MEVTDATGTIATYDYDFEGKRISKTTAGGTVNYHYSGQKVVYETDGSGNFVAEYTWDQSGRPVTMIRNGSTYYYHLNGHSDVIKLTDNSGSIVAEYEYDAWGNILAQSGTMAASNPFRYAGYMYDEETGLYYLLARYYDAEIGRFISRDTLLGDKTLPVSLNQYNYSYNNPVNFVDPNGKSPVSYFYDGIDGVYIIEEPGKRSILYNVSEKMAEIFNKEIVIGGAKIRPMTPEQGAEIRKDFMDMWNRPKTKQAFKRTYTTVRYVTFLDAYPTGDKEFDQALNFVDKAHWTSPRKWIGTKITVVKDWKDVKEFGSLRQLLFGF